ncbi:MAG: hypothetical protein VX112_03540 [Pseudomonadota bacterium]|nr:hypothetical protein [Pseudomonadota bacterium]
MTKFWSQPVQNLIQKSQAIVLEKSTFFQSPARILVLHPDLPGIRKQVSLAYPNANLDEWVMNAKEGEQDSRLSKESVEMVVSHLIMQDVDWPFAAVLQVAQKLTKGCPWIFTLISDDSGILIPGQDLAIPFGWDNSPWNLEQIVALSQQQGLRNPVFERCRIVCEYPDTESLLTDIIELKKGICPHINIDAQELRNSLLKIYENTNIQESSPHSILYAIELMVGVMISSGPGENSSTEQIVEIPLKQVRLKKNEDQADKKK